MISMAMCTQILNQNGKKYSAEEIKLIRNFLTKLAMIEFKMNIKKN